MASMAQLAIAAPPRTQILDVLADIAPHPFPSVAPKALIAPHAGYAYWAVLPRRHSLPFVSDKIYSLSSSVSISMNSPQRRR
jgi:hypothetical protein